MHRVERKRDGISLSPAAYALIGRAEGLAAGLGADAVTAEHVLLALIWRPERDWPLALAGTTREAVDERLQARGVRLPIELPPSQERPAGAEQRVYFPEAQFRDVSAPA